MAPSDDSTITDHFPHKHVTPIVGQPTYETLRELHLKLNENAVKVHSNLGNGALGYLGVTVSPAIYDTLSATPFVTPVNPGNAPVFPEGAQGPQITNIRTVFTDATTAFNRYNAVCNAISALIVEAIDPMYLATLRLPYVGLGTRTPLELLAHLYANYAKITASDLDKNDAAMKLPCDVNLPIESLFKQIDDAIEYASAGQAPYSPRQVLNIAYQLVLRTGIFVDDCKLWKKQTDNYKTWPQFKLDFAAAYQDYNESRDLSPRAAGFSATDVADYHDETIDAIANLATATAADRQAVANLTTTNASLTKDLSTSTTKLLAALTTITVLTKQLADLRSAASPPVPTANTQTSGERKHYCWSCGHRCLHSSSKCPVPKDGHQKGAKAADTMNGSTLNKPPARS
jgi:hypothetical protein